ncbi:hypothetical protein [Plantactinospora sp. B24E8]
MAPWVTVAAVVAGGLLLALAAGVLPARRMLRWRWARELRG